MEEKYQKRVKYILLFLIALLLTFLITSLLKKTGETELYNNFYVEKKDLGYMTEIYINDKGPFYINTVYSPKDVENIKVDFNLKKVIKDKKQIYMAIDPYDPNLKGRTTVAALELNNIIEAFFNIPVSSAFIKEKGNYTIKNCPEQNKTEAVFWLKLGNETKILKTGDNCVVLEAKEQEDLVKEADAISFRLLGIIK